MRLSVWIVRQFIRFWPLRGGHPANDPNTRYIDSSRLRRKPLYIPTDEELMHHAYVRQLSRNIAGLGISRRRLIDWVADEIYAADGRFVDSGGNVVTLEEVDEVFPDDPSGRWPQYFQELGNREMKQAVQKKVVPRIRLIAMAWMAREDRLN